MTKRKASKQLEPENGKRNGQQPAEKSPVPPSAWATAGPAAYDFRSDTMTRPTLSMLRAIQETTLDDDVCEEDGVTNALEKYMAELTGHQAALFVLSGTMGNQLAMRSHLTQPPHSVLCDHRAHILKYEAGGIANLSGAFVTGIVPSNGRYLTLDDIKKHVVISDNVHYCPTRVISLENTINGIIMPLSVVKEISTYARLHDIRIHLDGARIWEAVVAGAGSLTEFTKEFDSVSLCFSKGLGAPVGSILVANEKLIKHARWTRKSIGGGLRQSGVVTAAARVAVDETFGKGPNGKGGLLKRSHVIAKQISEIWTGLGGVLESPTETNMIWLDLDHAGIDPDEFVRLGKEKGLKFFGGRLVVHYQISEDAVKRMEELMKEVMQLKAAGGSKGASNGTEKKIYGK